MWIGCCRDFSGFGRGLESELVFMVGGYLGVSGCGREGWEVRRCD